MKKEASSTHLEKKNATTDTTCTGCKAKISKNTLYYLEVGNKEHIHSLLARRFCVDCYTKMGESRLLTGQNKS